MSTPCREKSDEEIFIEAATAQESGVISKVYNETDILSNINFPFVNPRQILPGRVPPQSFSIWSTMKAFVGQDLTHISMPVTLNEPLSFLHKFIECFAQQSLFDSVINTNDPVDRMEYVGAYFALCQSSMSYRNYKPFNPLLGETYEVVVDAKNCYLVTEQVSHHPPISAFHLCYPRVVCHGSVEMGIKFWGTSIDIIMDGPLTFELYDKKGEIESLITLNFPIISGRNIFLGKQLLDEYLYFYVFCVLFFR